MASKRDPIVPLHAKIVAGGIAGIIGTSIVFPLDLLKTRVQSSASRASPLAIARAVLASEGAAGLYAGLAPNLIGVAPEKALKLAVNDAAREAFTRRNAAAGGPGLRPWQEVVSGGLAGFLQVAVTNPMEIVKMRLQLAGTSSAAPSAVSVVRGLGLRGLYTGVAATWARDVPFSFVFFPVYANLRALLAPDGSVLGTFTAGALAGSIAAGAVTPCDVVKTRLQVEGGTARYGGVVGAFTRIYAEEGASAFAKGLVPRMCVQAPLFGCTLLSYEILKRLYAA